MTDVKLQQRGKKGIWWLKRRVPRRFSGVDDRDYLWASLGTDSHKEALRRADAVWAENLARWEALLQGDTSVAEERYAAARKIARSHGVKYVPAEVLAERPLAEIQKRVEIARSSPRPKATARAVLGAEMAPEMTVKRALETYWTLAADEVLGKSVDQIRRWRNPRIKAIKNFANVVGDVRLEDITPDEMMEFREWWLARVQSGEVRAGTANKDFTHLSRVLSLVNQQLRLGLDIPLSGWSLKDTGSNKRASFTTKWIQEKLLAPGALAGLNPEARALFLGMVNTGYRPSEGAVLTRDQIRLDANIPHISIEPVGRTLKSNMAQRKIPLLGVSLEAFREFPDGFARYAQSADPTAVINNYLRNNGLAEVTGRLGTTVYSLRHSFQARMVQHGVDDRIRREIFGHALTEDAYGDIGLDVKAAALEPVAL